MCERLIELELSKKIRLPRSVKKGVSQIESRLFSLSEDSLIFLITLLESFFFKLQLFIGFKLCGLEVSIVSVNRFRFASVHRGVVTFDLACLQFAA